ncbi:MAG TPA: cellulase family glycosylhydrolase [Gemmataceae bacterium]
MMSLLCRCPIALCPAIFLLLPLGALAAPGGKMPLVRVGEDRRSFVLEGTGEKFVPWGFNYDHDEKGRLIEDYWAEEWDKVAEDFREMKELGANVVRVHLQLGKFMKTADTPDRDSLEKLGKLLGLAERVGLYLDLTGLGCYHKKDVPAWYDPLDEAGRWEVQARFWEAVARTCAESPAVFCYDLMNEPVVPGGKGKREDWLGPALGDKHFVQFITLETKGRERPEIARQWVGTLVRAIRKHDRRHLITVGLVPWSLDRPGLTSGFVPEKVAGELDFVAVHIYPESGKVAEALKTLEGFAVGKPVVVEEMFPLKCSTEELAKFVKESEKVAAGWVGFYWGKTPEELGKAKTIAEAITLNWLEFFQERAREIGKQGNPNP